MSKIDFDPFECPNCEHLFSVQLEIKSNPKFDIKKYEKRLKTVFVSLQMGIGELTKLDVKSAKENFTKGYIDMAELLQELGIRK